MNTNQDLNSVELANRTLWFDGDTTVSPDFLVDLLLSGKSIDRGVYVDHIDDAVIQYNKVASKPLEVKYGVKPLDRSWNIPTQYKEMDVKGFILSLLLKEIERNDWLGEDVDIRLQRVEQELELFKSYDRIDLLKTLIYIVDVFRKDNVVWGIGRGSSCSSYILYLVGVHDVDSIFYGLEITEFFR